MSDEDQIVDSADTSFRAALKATAIDWLINTPPGAFYVGCAVMLVLLIGLDARWHQQAQTWLDKNGPSFIHFTEIMLGSLLAYKGAGKVVVHLTEKAKAKAASTLTVTATSPASVSATASASNTEQKEVQP